MPDVSQGLQRTYTVRLEVGFKDFPDIQEKMYYLETPISFNRAIGCVKKKYNRTV